MYQIQPGGDKAKGFGHEDYEQQYSGDSARYPHYWTGTTDVSSPLDGHLLRGATFDAYKSRTSDAIVCSLAGIAFPPDVPEGMQERVVASMDVETFEERGITYQAEPYQFPGNGEWGISVKVIDNPKGISTMSYGYTKTGEGDTFQEAAREAFEAPEVELMDEQED